LTDVLVLRPLSRTNPFEKSEGQQRLERQAEIQAAVQAEVKRAYIELSERIDALESRIKKLEK
jgi:hypothetical protein